MKIENSLIIPVYKNEDSIFELLSAITEDFGLDANVLEVIFVVDGSPDKSFDILKSNLKKVNFRSKIILLSKNFGSQEAIREGLRNASGEYFAVIAADLQERPGLSKNFFEILKNNEIDIVVGVRTNRQDPLLTKLFSTIFWFFYRKLINSKIPNGGVDIFACTKAVRDVLVALDESNSSLIAQIFWVGFTIKEYQYSRDKRIHGKSSWTFRKKVKYMFDNVFSFSDLPIKLLLTAGLLGALFFGVFGLMTLAFKYLGKINVPGYTGIVMLTGFFGALNLFGLGIVGVYAWRIFENTKRRPLSIAKKIINYNDNGDN